MRMERRAAFGGWMQAFGLQPPLSDDTVHAVAQYIHATSFALSSVLQAVARRFLQYDQPEDGELSLSG